MTSSVYDYHLHNIQKFDYKNEECNDCVNISYCEYSDHCKFSSSLFNCTYCQFSDNCVDCDYLYGCINCNNSYGLEYAMNINDYSQEQYSNYDKHFNKLNLENKIYLYSLCINLLKNENNTFFYFNKKLYHGKADLKMILILIPTIVNFMINNLGLPKDIFPKEVIY